MGGFCLLVELHWEGSALQPAQQAFSFKKTFSDQMSCSREIWGTLHWNRKIQSLIRKSKITVINTEPWKYSHTESCKYSHLHWTLQLQPCTLYALRPTPYALSETLCKIWNLLNFLQSVSRSRLLLEPNYYVLIKKRHVLTWFCITGMPLSYQNK